MQTKLHIRVQPFQEFWRILCKIWNKSMHVLEQSQYTLINCPVSTRRFKATNVGTTDWLQTKMENIILDLWSLPCYAVYHSCQQHSYQLQLKLSRSNAWKIKSTITANCYIFKLIQGMSKGTVRINTVLYSCSVGQNLSW